MFDMFGFLRDEGISPEIITEIQKFRERFPVEGTLSSRVPEPRYLYYGKDVWEEAATALLCGENLLLVGPKATGKNVLAENLACVFGRPSWDVSFYINTDAATLLGTDTFVDGAVSLRKGPIYQCAEKGGFGVLDEINMAKMSLWLCSTPHWTSAGPSICPAMSGSSSTTPPALSPP